MSIAEALLSAEDFVKLADVGPLAELVRGRVEAVNMPSPRHGIVCGTVAHILLSFVKPRGLGRVATNDSGIVTERNPDTVRGADVAYYSYARVPKGPVPTGYFTIAPEVAFEVLSPDDRWPKLLRKIGEYLDAGVLAVCVLDPENETAQIFRAEQPAETLSAEEELTLPEALSGFQVRVREFFE